VVTGVPLESLFHHLQHAHDPVEGIPELVGGGRHQDAFGFRHLFLDRQLLGKRHIFDCYHESADSSEDYGLLRDLQFLALCAAGVNHQLLRAINEIVLIYGVN